MSLTPEMIQKAYERLVAQNAPFPIKIDLHVNGEVYTITFNKDGSYTEQSD